jgi:hypothetical protein
MDSRDWFFIWLSYFLPDRLCRASRRSGLSALFAKRLLMERF